MSYLSNSTYIRHGRWRWSGAVGDEVDPPEDIVEHLLTVGAISTEEDFSQDEISEPEPEPVQEDPEPEEAEEDNDEPEPEEAEDTEEV